MVNLQLKTGGIRTFGAKTSTRCLSSRSARIRMRWASCTSAATRPESLNRARSASSKPLALKRGLPCKRSDCSRRWKDNAKEQEALGMLSPPLLASRLS